MIRSRDFWVGGSLNFCDYFVFCGRYYLRICKHTDGADFKDIRG
jgi:hypothetical protein